MPTVKKKSGRRVHIPDGYEELKEGAKIRSGDYILLHDGEWLKFKPEAMDKGAIVGKLFSYEQQRPYVVIRRIKIKKDLVEKPKKEKIKLEKDWFLKYWDEVEKSARKGSKSKPNNEQQNGKQNYSNEPPY